MLQKIVFLLTAKRFCVVSLLLFYLAPQVGYGQNVPKQAAAEAVALESGKPIEREFAGGMETHGYRIKLIAGQYAKIVIEQREVDVAAQLYAPDENLITRFDRELRLKENEEIEFVAASTGEYRLDVMTKFKSAAGRYAIRLAETRDATESDRLLFEARAADAKGIDLVLVGKYAEAAPLVARALEIVEKQLGADGADVGHFLNRLGYLQRQQGDYAAAEAVLLRARALNEKTLGLEHPETIESIQNLGLVYRSQNDFAKADKMYRQSLALTEKVLGAEHPKMVQQLVSLETVLHELGDAEQAERVLLRALTIAEKNYEPDSLTVTNVLNNLGAIYLDDEKYDRAEPYFRRVLASYEKTIGTENDRYSNTLQNLGIVLRHRKDYAQALQVYRQALAIREKTLGKEHLYLAPLLNNIANVYHALGDDAQALETQRRALDIAEKSGGAYHGYTIQSLANIARYYTATGDAANALAFQTLNEERTETALALDLAIGSERQKFLQLDATAEKTSRTISLNVNLAADNPQASALAALVVLQRKGRVLDAMSDSFAALRTRADAEDKKMLDELNSITEQLAKITLEKSAKTPLDEQRKQINDLTEKKETLEADISRRNAEFRAASLPVTLDAVRAEIPSDAALVEFAVYEPYNAKAANTDEAYGEPRYIAYILQRTGDVQWKDLGDRKTIDAGVEEWRKALADPKSKNASTLARSLDAKIMQPVRAALGDAKQILISPDGELNLIPFEALVDEKNQYLIENYSFAYLTSGRDLLRMKIARASKSKSLLIANPQFGETVSEQTLAVNRTRKISAAKRHSKTAVRHIFRAGRRHNRRSARHSNAVSRRALSDRRAGDRNRRQTNRCAADPARRHARIFSRRRNVRERRISGERR